MIGAALVFVALAFADRTITWRVDPLTPRVGDRVVLEAVLEPTPRDQVAVIDKGDVLGLVGTGEFELRRDGVALILSRTYVAASSGAFDLPNPEVRSGEFVWRARPARLDVIAVEPGRKGRELVDPLSHFLLDEPRSWRDLVPWIALASCVGLALWRRRVASRRARAVPARLEPPPSWIESMTARLDAIESAFATEAVPIAATADALRDLLRDALTERTGEPARARTSTELDALARTTPVGDAAFCGAILAAVEAQCYGRDLPPTADEVARWIAATRAWLLAPRVGP